MQAEKGEDGVSIKRKKGAIYKGPTGYENKFDQGWKPCLHLESNERTPKEIQVNVACFFSNRDVIIFASCFTKVSEFKSIL